MNIESIMKINVSGNIPLPKKLQYAEETLKMINNLQCQLEQISD